MPIKKTKTTPEAEIVKAADPVPATNAKTEKSKPVKTSKPVAPSKSSAATHKAPARKPAVRKAAAAAASAGTGTAPVVAGARPAFDPSAFHAEIAQEAYYLWVNRGGGSGQEHEDWLRAVEIVRARYE